MVKLKRTKDTYEFPDSGHVVVKFTKSDEEIFDAASAERTDHSRVASRDSSTDDRFNCSVAAVVFAGILGCLISRISISIPRFGGVIYLLFTVYLREWQRLHGAKITRSDRAILNYESLMTGNPSYIPYYNSNWVFGEKHKPYKYQCICDQEEEEVTSNESECVSPSTRSRTTR